MKKIVIVGLLLMASIAFAETTWFGWEAPNTIDVYNIGLSTAHTVAVDVDSATSVMTEWIIGNNTPGNIFISSTTFEKEQFEISTTVFNSIQFFQIPPTTYAPFRMFTTDQFHAMSTATTVGKISVIRLRRK